MNDSLKLTGTYILEIRDIHGNVRDVSEIKNLVVTAGKGLITSRLGASSANAATYVAVGTSSTAASAGQTALVSEITDSGLERAAATVTQTTITTTNDTYQATYTWTASGSKTVEEVGVFNASSAGTMLSRAVTGTKSVTSGETIVLTYRLQLT